MQYDKVETNYVLAVVSLSGMDFTRAAAPSDSCTRKRVATTATKRIFFKMRHILTPASNNTSEFDIIKFKVLRSVSDCMN